MNLQSDLSKLSKIDLFVDNVMQQFGIKEDFSGIISVPLRECVENAITHGNKCDKSKKVNVEVRLEKSELSFSVADEGQGFDYNSFLQKGIEQHKKNGLLKVKLLTKDLSFSKNGSQVSYKVNVPFSLPINNERVSILKHPQKMGKMYTQWQ
jgi:serine/threonine-protein kinase RsbW